MTEKGTNTGYSGPLNIENIIEAGLCPKCQQPSEMGDVGGLTQCMSCGLLMGNELKEQIIENRQTVMNKCDEFDDQYEML